MFSSSGCRPELGVDFQEGDLLLEFDGAIYPSTDIKQTICTSLYLNSPVHSQPSLGHFMINDRTFRSVALSRKVASLS